MGLNGLIYHIFFAVKTFDHNLKKEIKKQKIYID